MAKTAKKLRILALDPATHCGFAHSSGPSGMWDLSVKRDESSGMRLLRLRAELIKLHEKHGIDLLVFEASRNSKFGNAVKIAGQIQGVIEVWALDNGVEYRGYSPKEIKKHATNNGNADKDAMVAAAEKKWPKIKIVSNDHADALHLLDLALSEYAVTLSEKDKGNGRNESPTTPEPE
jgi:Holliday junction resolvasome RuvABC endonuclease subunit